MTAASYDLKPICFVVGSQKEALVFSWTIWFHWPYSKLQPSLHSKFNLTMYYLYRNRLRIGFFCWSEEYSIDNTFTVHIFFRIMHAKTFYALIKWLKVTFSNWPFFLSRFTRVTHFIHTWKLNCKLKNARYQTWKSHARLKNAKLFVTTQIKQCHEGIAENASYLGAQRFWFLIVCFCNLRGATVTKWLTRLLLFYNCTCHNITRNKN